MKEQLQKMLSDNRYQHSLGVCEVATALAKRYNADVEKAYVTGLLHDCAKDFSASKIKSECERLKVELDSIESACIASLAHAPLGSAIAKESFGITDTEILDAIRYHTIGRANMTLLDKIIYLADMIEPSRTFSGVEYLRKIAMENLDTAVIQGLEYSIIHIIDSKSLLHPNTIHARNTLLNQANKKEILS